MELDGFLDQVLDFFPRVAYGDHAGKVGDVCPHEIGAFS